MQAQSASENMVLLLGGHDAGIAHVLNALLLATFEDDWRAEAGRVKFQEAQRYVEGKLAVEGEDRALHTHTRLPGMAELPPDSDLDGGGRSAQENVVLVNRGGRQEGFGLGGKYVGH